MNPFYHPDRLKDISKLLRKFTYMFETIVSPDTFQKGKHRNAQTDLSTSYFVWTCSSVNPHLHTNIYIYIYIYIYIRDNPFRLLIVLSKFLKGSSCFKFIRLFSHCDLQSLCSKTECRFSM